MKRKKTAKGAGKEDPILILMRQPEGTEIMLSTNFDQLFDKLLDLLSVMLSKTNMIFEDKIIIENALSIIVGILMFKKECYSKFTGFQSTKSQTVRNIEEVIVAGLLCSEEKVRADFG